MGALARIVEVEVLDDYVLRVTFTDGLVRELDFTPMLAEAMFATLRDAALFAAVTVDPLAGTISWPTGIDLDPDVLHGDRSSPSKFAPVARREFRLRPTG